MSNQAHFPQNRFAEETTGSRVVRMLVSIFGISLLAYYIGITPWAEGWDRIGEYANPLDIAVLAGVSAFGLLCQLKWPKAKWALALPTVVLLGMWAWLNVTSGPMTLRTWLMAAPLLFPTILTPMLATLMFAGYRRRVNL